LPSPPFREVADPDEKRKEILWIAISFIVILSSWLAVVMLFGYRPLAAGVTYDEAVLGLGLGLLILCAILYLGVREREQRHTNRRLLSQLGSAVANLDNRVRHLNGLCSISGELIGSLDTNHIGRLVVNSLVGNMAVGGASLVLADKGTGLPVYVVKSPDTTSPGEPNSPHPKSAWPGPLLSPHGRLVDPEAQVRAWNQLGHLVCAPIHLENGLVGVLSAHRDSGEELFTPEDLNTLTTFANMAAKAFESCHLYHELRESYLATVRSLLYSLDARDNYAAAHGHRVAELAVAMAERMGLPESMTRDIEVFAPLHDVGKVGIPDSILLKAGPLTKEERDICKRHPVIGERIIRHLKPGPDALALVRNHHESWDGRGYPDGLQGEQISLIARIVQVADCYDALISERPYRPVLTEQEVLDHFCVNAGIRYDPTVVSALTAVLQEERPASQAPTTFRGGGSSSLHRIGTAVPG